MDDTNAIFDEISKRDHAEEVIDQLLELIGVEYEWSSCFGFDDAVEAASIRMKNLEQLLIDWYEHGKLEDAKYHIAMRTAEILVPQKTTKTHSNIAHEEGKNG